MMVVVVVVVAVAGMCGWAAAIEGCLECSVGFPFRILWVVFFMQDRMDGTDVRCKM